MKEGGGTYEDTFLQVNCRASGSSKLWHKTDDSSATHRGSVSRDSLEESPALLPPPFPICRQVRIPPRKVDRWVQIRGGSVCG